MAVPAGIPSSGCEEILLRLMQGENSRAELRVALISTYLQGLHTAVDGKALVSAIITVLGMMLQTAA